MEAESGSSGRVLLENLVAGLGIWQHILEVTLFVPLELDLTWWCVFVFVAAAKI